MAQATVQLKCSACRGIFYFPRTWLFHRMLRGFPLVKCRGCEPAAYRTV